jgi:hypothetical protein
MKSQGASMLIWGFALIFPVLLFIVIGDNLNERQPVLPFIVCPLLFAGAAWLTAKNLKWVAWAFIAGLAEAALLVFAV